MSKVQTLPNTVVTISNAVLREAVRVLNEAEDAGFAHCRVELGIYGVDAKALVKSFKVLVAQRYENKALGISLENNSKYHDRKNPVEKPAKPLIVCVKPLPEFDTPFHSLPKGEELVTGFTKKGKL